MTAPNTKDQDVTLFATTNYRGKYQQFGIRRRDRRLPMYLIGKTGMGKSTLMENMIIADLEAGEGVAVLDPHGDLIQNIIHNIPSWRAADVIYFNPADKESPLAFNILQRTTTSHNHLIASGLVSVLKKIWQESWGPRMEYILRNTVLTLLEYQETTVVDIPRLLIDKSFRTALVTHLEDQQLRDFWLKEYEVYPPNFRNEAIAPILNKVGQFLTNKLIRTIISQQQSSFHMRQVMDEGRILLADLSKGKLGEDASRLLGAMLLTQIELAALSRADTPEAERKDFYLYCDEFFNFASASFTGMLAEARKYRLSLILAHQYIEQLDEELRAAIFGNAATIIAFRLGAQDAEVLAKEFYPVFNVESLINLPQYHICLKLAINGVTSQPFSAVTLPPRRITNQPAENGNSPPN